MGPILQGIASQTRKQPTYGNLVKGYYGEEAVKQLKAAITPDAASAKKSTTAKEAVTAKRRSPSAAKKQAAGKAPHAGNDFVAIHRVHDAASLEEAERRLEAYVSAICTHYGLDCSTFEVGLNALASPEHATPFAVGLDVGQSLLALCLESN